MFPFRKPKPVEEAPLESGPPTLRSERMLAAAPVGPASDSIPPSDGYMPVLERSDIIQAVKRREPLPVNDDDMELQDEDLEVLFDEDAIFEELSEPDTERMVHIDNFDTDPPPPTMRCPTG